MANKSFTFELTDDEGKHTLQSDKNCVWKCKTCGEEIKATKKSVIDIKDKKVPKCPNCGHDMNLHYWLD